MWYFLYQVVTQQSAEMLGGGSSTLAKTVKDCSAGTGTATAACPAGLHASCSQSCVLCGGSGSVQADETPDKPAVELPAGGTSFTETYWKGRRVERPGQSRPTKISEAQRTLAAAVLVLRNAV